jgi:hypothetical protein
MINAIVADECHKALGVTTCEDRQSKLSGAMKMPSRLEKDFVEVSWFGLA